jgi:dipeptide/tripeptide permease
MLKDFGRRIGLGALVGVAVAGACIAVGILRAGVAIILRRYVPRPPTSDDVKVLAYYVGGFAIAGILVSAIWPLLTSRFARYVGFSLAGIVVMVVILAAEKGGLRAHGRSDWVITVLLGIFFGCAFGWGRGRGPAA